MKEQIISLFGMFSLLAYLSDNIGRITLGALTFIAFGCSNQITSETDIVPKHFKVKVPFIFNGRGIIINTYWGSEEKHYVLCIDNYSPSWIKKSQIQYGKSFTRSTDIEFKTSTADGSGIRGDVGICDSLSFENILFKKIPFYVIYNSKDNPKDDGVFGIDMMSKGIWKIDFKNSELTFTSDIDSLQGINQTEVFPSTFNERSIKVDVRFGNNFATTMAIDLGFNGDFILPLKEFNKLDNTGKVFVDSARFSTPGNIKIVNRSMIFDTVNINGNWFLVFIASSKTVKERLIGVQFFRRFDFVIFDFINKRIYVPKKVW